MSTNIDDIMSFVSDNDVKFIRLAFCDPFGVHKNISILAEELESAFTDGVPFDGSAINGFLDVKKSDLLLFPDPETLTILPWRPYPGRVIRFYCQITYPDKTPFEGDGRYILRQAVNRASTMGLTCNIGSSCEFYLFKTDEHGEPTKTTLDQGGYLDISPLDKGEDIRREICLYLDEMQLSPESSYHEQGPGQNEVNFKFSDALSSADNLVTFKSVVRSISGRNGLYASFMPKPILDKIGSALHINISLNKNGENIFDSTENEAGSFIEGVLSKILDMTLFLNPIANSYERLGNFESPEYISWSNQNRSQLIRIPSTNKNEKKRMELRSADPVANPYLAFALILHAGLDGIEQNLSLRPATDANLFIIDENITKSLTKLPNTLEQALEIAKHSDFIKQHLHPDFLDRYFKIKELENIEFLKSTSRENFYLNEYFNNI